MRVFAVFQVEFRQVEADSGDGAWFEAELAASAFALEGGKNEGGRRKTGKMGKDRE